MSCDVVEVKEVEEVKESANTNTESVPFVVSRPVRSILLSFRKKS